MAEKEKIYVEDKDIVVPGELLASGMDYLPSGQAFREQEKLYASTIGLASVKGRVIKIIPLSGRYMPKKGDSVIGKVLSMNHSGWQVDIECPYNADLGIGDASMSYIDTRRTDMSEIFDVNDYVFAGIFKISENMFVKLTAKDRQYRRLRGGNVIRVSPTKIPRIIGKQGSMISMIKEATKCDIIVGQNGLVWIKGTEPAMESLAAAAITKIEKESHTSGLTDKIKVMLEKRGGN